MNDREEKIGILTYHYTTNFGGVLQCWALYNCIRRMGYENVEIVNFVPRSRTNFRLLRSLGVRKDVSKMHLSQFMPITFGRKLVKKLRYLNESIHKFETFRKAHLCLSEEVDEESLWAVVDRYDTLIVGSDQVWNFTEHKSRSYFLDFHNFSGRRISYAACCGFKKVEGSDRASLKLALDKFDYVSVRNLQTQEFVQELTDSFPTVVADPTLLVDFVPASTCGQKENYILTYVIGVEKSFDHGKAIQAISERYGKVPVKAVVITATDFSLCYWADKVHYILDPLEWAEMIANAAFVYTDSFHGVLLALKYHVPFLGYYIETERAHRLIDVRERYGLGDRIVDGNGPCDFARFLDTEIDFERVDSLIANHVEHSMDFLSEALGGIKMTKKQAALPGTVGAIEPT